GDDGRGAARLTAQPKRLTARDVEGDPFDGRMRRTTRCKVEAQVVDLEQRSRYHPRRLRDCGSRMSRRPSPSRFNPRTVRKIASPGNTDNQGAVVIWSRASDNMLPQLG